MNHLRNHGVQVRQISMAMLALLATVGSSAIAEPPSPTDSTKPSGQPQASPAKVGLGALAIWDDGLAEMSYYKAVDRIYNKPRSYTRAVLVNRQWLSQETGVKSTSSDDRAVPIFKLNIVEQIPTENYNYRYQTTCFLNRYVLTPLKVVYSSQEWCGTTFKHLRWQGDVAIAQSFSYFGDEGDKVWTFDGQAVPYESLLLIARDVVATGKPRELKVLTSLRSNHSVALDIKSAKLMPQATFEQVSIAAGSFKAVRVDVQWDGPRAGFLIEAAPPYRLLRYVMGNAHGELLHTERRAYWNRDWPSDFYPTEKAP